MRQAQDELAAMGARPRKLLLSGVESLTPSERRVARMAAQGMSNKELAAALWISENTVKTHLKGIFQKTTATSRTQAIVRIAGDAQFARRLIA